MKQLRRSRPSPALVVAVMALVAALAGSAVAEVATTAKLNKKDKRQVRNIAKKQANKRINKLAPTLSVANAQNAQNAENAQNAQNAENAQQLGGLGPGGFLQNPVRVVTNDSAATSAAGQNRNSTASCPAGERAIAGGGGWVVPGNFSPNTNLNLLRGTHPIPNTGGTDAITGWNARGVSDSASPRLLRAYAVCIPE